VSEWVSGQMKMRIEIRMKISNINNLLDIYTFTVFFVIVFVQYELIHINSNVVYNIMKLCTVYPGSQWVCKVCGDKDFSALTLAFQKYLFIIVAKNSLNNYWHIVTL